MVDEEKNSTKSLYLTDQDGADALRSDVWQPPAAKLVLASASFGVLPRSGDGDGIGKIEYESSAGRWWNGIRGGDCCRCCGAVSRREWLAHWSNQMTRDWRTGGFGVANDMPHVLADVVRRTCRHGVVAVLRLPVLVSQHLLRPAGSAETPAGAAGHLVALEVAGGALPLLMVDLDERKNRARSDCTDATQRRRLTATTTTSSSTTSTTSSTAAPARGSDGGGDRDC